MEVSVSSFSDQSALFNVAERAKAPAFQDSSDRHQDMAYVASLLVIVTSCLLAVSVPALRAAGIDPIATLRTD